MKNLVLLFLPAICIMLFNSNYTNRHNHSETNYLLKSLIREKANTDKLLSDQNNKLIVLVKVPGSNDLVLVKNDKWPETVEYTYNVLKNAAGKIILVAQIPYSESGDWNIQYKYYFDTEGKTFAFERNANFFNSECTDGAAHEVIDKYYDRDFKTLNETYKLTNEKHKALIKAKCTSPYDFTDYKIYKNVNACLADFKINLP
jgi:hypothetical protein